MRALVEDAINQLCAAFERGGYNPTPIVDLGVLVANADGKVDPDERAILLDIFQTLLDTKLTAGQVDHLVTASLEVIQLAGVDARARLLGAILDDCHAAEPGLVVALAVAFASEGLSSAERTILEKLADATGLPRTRIDELARTFGSSVAEGPTSVRNLLGAAGPPSSRKL